MSWFQAIFLMAIMLLVFVGISSTLLTRRHFWLMVEHRLYQANQAYLVADLLARGEQTAVRQLLVGLGPPDRHGISSERWRSGISGCDIAHLNRAARNAVEFCRRVNCLREPRPVPVARSESAPVF